MRRSSAGGSGCVSIFGRTDRLSVAADVMELERSNFSADVDNMRTLLRAVNVRTRWVLYPNTARRQMWDVVVLVAMLYTALWVPIEVTILDWSEDYKEALDARWVVNRVFDVAFMVDIGVNCLTAYWDVKKMVWRRSHYLIFCHYARGWLLVDLISTVPSLVEAMLIFTPQYQSGETSAWEIAPILRMLRLLKLLRVVRASRLFGRWESRIASRTRSRASSASRWGSSSCATGSRARGSSSGGWRRRSAPASATGSPYNLLEQSRTAWRTRRTTTGRATRGAQFLVSWHWATMTITSIGYGDITPVTPSEFAVSIIAQLIGAIAWASAIRTWPVRIHSAPPRSPVPAPLPSRASRLTPLFLHAGIFANIDPHTTAWKQEMDAINQFMADRQCEQPLMQRVREYCVEGLQRVAREQVPPSPRPRPLRLSAPSPPLLLLPSRRQRVLGLLSPALQGEVAMSSLARLLSGVTYPRTPRPSSTSSSKCLHPRGYAQREVVELELHVIHVGMAAVDGVIKLRGQAWNEDMIVASAELRQPLAGVRAHVPRVLRARAARARAHRVALPRPLQGDPQGRRPPRPPPLAPPQPPPEPVPQREADAHRDSPFTLPGGIGGESSMPPMEAPVGSRSSLNRLGSAHASRPGGHAPHAIQRLPSWRVKTAKGVQRATANLRDLVAPPGASPTSQRSMMNSSYLFSPRSSAQRETATVGFGDGWDASAASARFIQERELGGGCGAESSAVAAAAGVSPELSSTTPISLGAPSSQYANAVGGDDLRHSALAPAEGSARVSRADASVAGLTPAAAAAGASADQTSMLPDMPGVSRKMSEGSSVKLSMSGLSSVSSSAVSGGAADASWRRVLAGMHSSTQAQMQQQAIATHRLAAQLERLSRAVVSGDGATAEILSGSRPITPTAVEVEARISTRAAGGPGKSPLGP